MEGKYIQDIADINVPMKHIFFTIFPEGNKSYCVFSWVKENSDIFESYRKQLLQLEDYDRRKYLNKLLPMEAENIVIKPSSWDSLESHQQEHFSMLIWGMGQFYEIVSQESPDMFEETFYDLFEL